MHYRTICWKCPRTVTPSSTCHSCHQKAKHIMVNMKSTQPLKTSDISDTIHKRLSWRTTIVRLLPNAGTFHKGYIPYWQRIHFIVNTKSKNIKRQCVHLGAEETFLLQINIITFLGKTLISSLTSKLITVDSKKIIIEQTIHSVISNVRTRTKHHQMQMLILNRLD